MLKDSSNGINRKDPLNNKESRKYEEYLEDLKEMMKPGSTYEVQRKHIKAAQREIAARGRYVFSLVYLFRRPTNKRN